jgi:chemotaxis protein MotC
LRRRWLYLLAFAPLALPGFAGEHAGGKDAAPVEPIAAPPSPLSDMMLDVQRLQARMAKGDREAYAQQRAKMREVGAAIAAAGPEAFKVKAERDAVVVYLLSGGQPRDIAKIVERRDFPEAERGMLRGAAGYTLGREEDANALLTYNPRAESLRLGSQLAYAQSVLWTPRDAKMSLDLLDLARLLGPGTLVEEAALRREVLLVGDLRQPERVAFLARQYVERFGKSLYAGNFVAGLSETVARFDLCATLDDLDKFSALLNVAQPEQSRAFLLSIGRASLLLGRFDVASQAARSALKTAPPASADEARARLYDVAARFPRMDPIEAKAALNNVDQDKLTPGDRDLLAAATYVDANLYTLPPLDAYAEIWREASVAAARSPDLPLPTDAATLTIRRAEAAVDTAQSIRGKDPLR